MTIYIFVLKGNLNGENRSGAFLFLLGIFGTLVLSFVLVTQKCHLTRRFNVCFGPDIGKTHSIMKT